MINILIAYPYFSKQIMDVLIENKNKVNLMVDSGAFTAWNLGKTIHLNEYENFIKSLEGVFPNYNYVQLDVVHNPGKTKENLDIMRNNGLNPIPVFTRGDSKEYLDQLYTTTDYVMLGGIAFGEENKNYVKWFLDYNKNRKCHLLGFTQSDFIKYYKPYSIDSSSWTMGQRYGVISLYLGNGKMRRHQRYDFKESTIFSKFKNLKYFSLNELKLLFHDICWKNSGFYDGSFDQPKENTHSGIEAKSNLLWMNDLKKYCNTKYYLACADHLQVKTLINVYDNLKSKNLLEDI